MVQNLIGLSCIEYIKYTSILSGGCGKPTYQIYEQKIYLQKPRNVQESSVLKVLLKLNL